MNLILSLAAFLIAPIAQASDLDHLPRSFVQDGKRAVFVDFETATYDITYGNAVINTPAQATVVAEMTFQSFEEGYPVFDSVETPTRIQLDGRTTRATLVNSPDQATQVRRIEMPVKPGMHSLLVEVPIQQFLEFVPTGGVKSGFWMTDLKDRGYLERYLPTNLLFDRIKMKFRVHFMANTNQAIYTNGAVRKIDSQNFEIDYPEYFTASSLFFHTVPVGTMSERKFNYTTATGKILPVTIYTAAGDTALGTLDDATNRVNKNLRDMEADFGDFPHPSLTVYISSGGMEYCGATITSLGALAHEMFHSYFARGFMPANGNAGWIDEALATWHDVGYASMNALQGTSMMANHPYYTRETDTDAYSFGREFISFLNGKFAAQGGLKPFLNYILKTRVFAPMTTEEFMNEMSAYYHVSVEPEFRKYVFGTQSHDEFYFARRFEIQQSYQ